MRHQAAPGQRQAEKEVTGGPVRVEGSPPPHIAAVEISAARQIKGLAICGIKSRFDSAYRGSRLSDTTSAGTLVHESRARREYQRNYTGVDEVHSVSYLPATFTTLFFLAASLLLGLIR